ncbi:hypothetical protein GCM10023093_09650 [Nemorincola caseinilytica]|uniref:Secretion system C-terminal sorting domain-containing protein n=1 Tax=Nemorincola caseinilytica TaxID=2054315 RepID=A0ABP8N7H1_9BACT
MKCLRHILFGFLLSAGAIVAQAQSFTVVHDTVWLTATTWPSVATDTIYNPSSAGINIQWKVVATDMPTCMQDISGMCDPTACYQMNTLWPSSVHTSMYGPGNGLITLNSDVNSCPPGCYYVRARLNNAAIPTDTGYVTFIVCKPAPSRVTSTTQAPEIALYPNPATTMLTIEYGSADVKNIAIYNIIGRQVGIYPAGAHSATIGVEHVPAGIYYARLLNGRGDVVATRRFTRQ